MDELEITGIVKDGSGIVSHCAVKGYGVQNIRTIEKLIREKSYTFFIHEGDKKKKNVYTRTSPNGTTFLTTDPNGSDMDFLNVLPLLDGPLLRRLIE